MPRFRFQDRPVHHLTSHESRSRNAARAYWGLFLLSLFPTNVMFQTGWAQEVAPRPLGVPLLAAHAHNDYRHPNPLWDALHEGFTSIEADIFLVDGELRVAHDAHELPTAKTLNELYLAPLWTLYGANDGRVYPDGPTVTLLIDIKRDGKAVYRKLKETLRPYEAMLSRQIDGKFVPGAVHVIISGDRPWEAIESDPDRWMGVDGRLADLQSPLPAEVLPLISDRWGAHFKWRGEGPIPAEELEKLTAWVEAAHRAGRRIRFWATPESPAVWGVLRTLKVDMINTDRLSELRAFLTAATADISASAPSASRGEQTPDSDHPPVQRIGMIGCHRQDRPAPAFNRYLQSKPDLIVWMGDNVYADTPDDPSYIQTCYQRLRAQTAFQQLKQTIPFAVTWDDHDYGMNNEGKGYQLKTESQKLFVDFWEMSDHIPENQQGIYHARYFGSGEQRLQVILLDTRFHRDDPGDQGDTLGESQWEWLEQELQQPARLRLIASGYQVLLDREANFETWAKFPAAQRRLFETIQRADANGVIFLAGDQHYGEVSRQPNALGYDAIELMFSGINQAEPHVYNSYRVSNVAHALNAYALLDIQWETSDIDPPHVLFQCFDADTGQCELLYRINFSELIRKP